MLELHHRHLSNTREIGSASQNTPYIPSPKGRGLYGAFSVKLRHLRVCLGVKQTETQKCVLRQMRNFGPELLLCDALAIIRYNDLSVEYVPRLRKCQAIGHPMEVAVVFGLLHADCLEEEDFAFYVPPQNSHFPLTRGHLSLPNLKLAALVQVS